jgi:hypothetical protein
MPRPDSVASPLHCDLTDRLRQSKHMVHLQCTPGWALSAEENQILGGYQALMLGRELATSYRVT